MKDQQPLLPKIMWLLFFLGLVFGIAVLGSFAMHHSLDLWDEGWQKPSWTPPSWVFGPLWIILYGMIAISGWLLSIAPPSKQRNDALAYFFFQLFFNFLWSFIFFYFQRPFFGLIDILVLLFLIGMTIKTARPVSKMAALLLAPYFIWTLFAAALNAAMAFKSQI